MNGTLDPFRFVLAEKLGKTLAEIDVMPLDEYYQWAAFHTYRQAMLDMAVEKARR